MMKPKTYFALTLLLFLVVGTVHLLRILYAWDAVIAGWQVPMWLSWTVVIVLGLLAYQAYGLETKK